jgi:hypothetical protein
MASGGVEPLSPQESAYFFTNMGQSTEIHEDLANQELDLNSALCSCDVYVTGVDFFKTRCSLPKQDDPMRVST